MLDRKAKRYGQKPSSWYPWLHPATANDLDDAVATFGLWFDGKMAETVGSGKDIKPAHNAYDLLGIPRPSGNGVGIKSLRNIPGVGIHGPTPKAATPPPFTDPSPNKPW